MAPPLIQLTDIALTFGGTPLLDGAELSVSAGERVCLVGRNGSGKSTLLQDRRRADRARSRRALRAAGRHASATCRRSPTSPAMRRRSPMSRRASAPGDDPHQARYLLRAARPDRRRGPGAAVGRRGAPRGAGARAGARSPTSCCSTSRPTTSTCRPSNGWRASCAAQRARAGADQPRPALPRNAVARHGLARPRPDAAHRAAASRSSRPGATRCWPRRRSTSTSSTARSSREEHWMRYGVTARRKRNVRRMAELQALRQTPARLPARRPARR